MKVNKNLLTTGGDNEISDNHLNSKILIRKNTIDQFDTDLIYTVVYNYFQKNECVALKKNWKTFWEKSW